MTSWIEPYLQGGREGVAMRKNSIVSSKGHEKDKLQWYRDFDRGAHWMRSLSASSQASFLCFST